MIVVDNRWTGQNGIGRYANEVISRLTVPWVPIGPKGRPSSPSDFLLKRVSIQGAKPHGIYTPGYNGFLRGVPQLITVHDLIHLRGPGSVKYKSYYDHFLKPLIKKNRRVITVSETSKTLIERWLDAPEVSVLNAGNGCSAEFTPMGASFVGRRPYFLYVGNFKPHKNVGTIIESMRNIKEMDLLIVSSDVARANELVIRHNMVDRVQVVGGIDDLELARLYRGARATLQPSLIEGFGLPALESALSGAPVIFFEGCESVSEICAGGGLAVADATDANLWSEAMLSIRDGQRFPSALVSGGRFSWDRVAESLSLVLAEFD